MATISKNLLILEQTKENFKTAFAEKNVDVSNTPFTEYPNKFGEIQTGGGEDMLQQMADGTTNGDYFFYKYQGNNLEFVKDLNVSNFTRTTNMFEGCSNITNLDLSKWDVSHVLYMGKMFYSCTNLKTLNLSGWDTSNVTNMSDMFASCSKLVDLDLSHFNTSKVTIMSQMFRYCSMLESIIGLDLYSVTNNNYIVTNCSKLKNLYLKNIRKSISIGSGTTWGALLTNDSLINTVKELWDFTGSTSQTLTLSTTSKTNIANIYVKLVDITDEMLAQDQYAGNKKPCVVCESTDEGAMTLTEYATSKNWAIS